MGELHAKFVWTGPRRRPPAPRQVPLSSSNFARNSSAACSNIEFISLELQRFRAVSKSDRGKLCATFAGVVIALTLGSLCRSRALWPGSAVAHAIAISHVIPQQLVQTLNLYRWNCNVFGRSRKMTVGNYVRNLSGPGPATAHGHRSQTLQRLRCSPHRQQRGFCTTRSPLPVCRRCVVPSCSAISPVEGPV